jgi:plasmid stabilization system protein ParE
MTRNRGFVLHPEAARDLTEIWEYIAADNVAAASRFRASILETIRKLAIFPNQGHLRPDLASTGVRFHAVGEYLIAYAPAEDPLLVLAVVHGRRNPRIVAALLRSRFGSSPQ